MWHKTIKLINYLFGNSWHAATIDNTEIIIHETFSCFISILVIGFLIFFGWSATCQELLLIVAMFGFVLAHECGHVLMARFYGNECPQIIIHMFGGLANLKRESRSYQEEILVAAAGPFVNIMMVLAAKIYNYYVPEQDVTYIIYPNIIILLLNILPVYPLDGGRILRGIIWHITDNIEKATNLTRHFSLYVAILIVCLSIFKMQFSITIIFAFIAMVNYANTRQPSPKVDEN